MLNMLRKTTSAAGILILVGAPGLAHTLDAMLEDPILVNRPIVVTPKGIRLCRPSELVLDLLENPHFGVFTKEDGERIDTGRA